MSVLEVVNYGDPILRKKCQLVNDFSNMFIDAIKFNDDISVWNVSIGSDIFKIDNNQTFEISIPEKINCKIISNSRKNSKIYERILNSINGNTSFIGFEVFALNRFSRIVLRDTDVLIVADAANFTPRAIESLKRYLKAGGSIIWFAGENYAKLKVQSFANLSLPKLIKTVDLN